MSPYLIWNKTAYKVNFTLSSCFFNPFFTRICAYLFEEKTTTFQGWVCHLPRTYKWRENCCRPFCCLSSFCRQGRREMNVFFAGWWVIYLTASLFFCWNCTNLRVHAMQCFSPVEKTCKKAVKTGIHGHLQTVSLHIWHKIKNGATARNRLCLFCMFFYWQKCVMAWEAGREF